MARNHNQAATGSAPADGARHRPRHHSNPIMESSPMLWLTNYAAPYRLPAWDAIAENDDSFRVLVTADNEANRLWSGLHQSRPYIDLVKTWTLGQSNNLARFPFATSLRPLISSQDSIIIGGWDQPAYWQASAIAKLHKIPRVVFYESTEATHRYRAGLPAWLRKTFLRMGGETLLVPGVAAKRAVQRAGVSPERIVQTFNSIDQDAVLSAVALSGRARTAPLRLCFVGQLIPRKNLHSLLQAFCEADIGPAELHVVGQGPEAASLRALADSLLHGPEKTVRWYGGMNQQESLRIMVGCDALILPSSEEVWGLVVNEALTAGLHVVVSTNCGVYDSVAHMTGVLATEPDVASLIESLTRLSRMSPDWIEAPAILEEGSPKHFAQGVMLAASMASAMM
jgi:glycosyltransferase involved in cell wall biosynthesis